MAKQTRGRQKVDMKLIADESKRHVTFSKRRMGLFKKAAEINILTGAEVAAIVLSRHGKAYSFRTPGAKSFIDDFFVNRNHSPAPASEDGSRCEVELLMDELSRQEEEKERCEMEAKMMGDDSGDGLGFWWDRPIESMEMGELERFKEAVVKLREKVAERAEAVTMMDKTMPFMSLLNYGGTGDQEDYLVNGGDGGQGVHHGVMYSSSS